MKTRMFAVCVVIVLFFGIANAEISDGLVAYHPFNGNAHDESGHGNNRTVSGATLAMDTSGSMISAMPSGPYAGWSAQSETQGSVPIITSETGSFICFPRYSSSGNISGWVCCLNIKNIGGAGMIDVAVNVDKYTEQKQFYVDAGARYSLRPLVPVLETFAGFLPAQLDTLYFTASSTGYSQTVGLTSSLGPCAGSGQCWYKYVATGVPSTSLVEQYLIGSNSIDAVDVIKITDMSGSLPDGGGVVKVRAWDKDGKQLTTVGDAPPLSIYNHGTTIIRGADLMGRFSDGTPAAYIFFVESSKMFITNVNNSVDGSVKVPIIYSTGLTNFVSNSIGPRNTLKVTDMSGTIASGGIAIVITAWDASGTAIPESTSAEPLKLYSHGTTTISGSALPERFPSGTPLTYEFSINSPNMIVSNVKNSSDGTLNIPTVYTVGIPKFVSNSIGPRNTIYISNFTGWLGSTDGTVIKVRAWDVSGAEIPESGSSAPLKLHNYGTTSISGSDLAARFPSGSPMTYEFTVGSSGGVVITNVKSSSDGSINIPTVYTRPLESGVTYSYLTNYISDLNTIQITDMSGNISTDGASITIKARDVAGNIIPESSGATALKLYNYGTTTIEGKNLQNRFSGGVPATYQFYTGSSNAVVTNLTKSLDGTINIPTVFNTGYQEGGI